MCDLRGSGPAEAGIDDVKGPDVVHSELFCKKTRVCGLRKASVHANIDEVIDLVPVKIGLFQRVLAGTLQQRNGTLFG